MIDRLNREGFTLIEMLAVVVILGILATIMIPTVTTLIAKNKEDNFNNLKNSIISAAKIYVSDNRYNITLDSSNCDSNNQRNISMINGSEDMFIESNSGKLKIKILIDSGNLNDGNSEIINPKNDNRLNLDTSYIVVKYNCDTKDYDYKLEESYLFWSN